MKRHRPAAFFHLDCRAFVQHRAKAEISNCAAPVLLVALMTGRLVQVYEPDDPIETLFLLSGDAQIFTGRDIVLKSQES